MNQKTPEPLGPRTYELGPLLPLFNAMKEHLMKRAAQGTCTLEEAATLDALYGPCPDAPLGWGHTASEREGTFTIQPCIEI